MRSDWDMPRWWIVSILGIEVVIEVRVLLEKTGLRDAGE